MVCVCDITDLTWRDLIGAARIPVAVKFFCGTYLLEAQIKSISSSKNVSHPHSNLLFSVGEGKGSAIRMYLI